MDEKILRFLRLVPSARWDRAPVIWNDQVQEALNAGLVTVGWGGILKLTAAGEKAVRDPSN